AHPDAARAIWTRACDLPQPLPEFEGGGTTGACLELARLARDDDPAAADARARRACDLGNGLGCHLLAELHRAAAARATHATPAPGASAHPGGDARTLDDLACRRGSTEACATLADRASRGTDDPADPAEAYRYTSEACRLGSPSSCLGAALMTLR